MSWFHKPQLEIHLFPLTLTTSLEVVLLQRGSNASLCWTGFPCSAQPCLNSSAAAFEGLIIGLLFAWMFRHQSGKHKASSHFCALWATLCVKAFNECVPFCSISDSVLSLHSPASNPGSLSATGQRSGDPITISKTVKDYIAPLHLKTSQFCNKNVKPFPIWYFTFGPKSELIPCNSLCPVCCRSH